MPSGSAFLWTVQRQKVGQLCAFLQIVQQNLAVSPVLLGTHALAQLICSLSQPGGLTWCMLMYMSQTRRPPASQRYQFVVHYCAHELM